MGRGPAMLAITVVLFVVVVAVTWRNREHFIDSPDDIVKNGTLDALAIVVGLMLNEKEASWAFGTTGKDKFKAYLLASGFIESSTILTNKLWQPMREYVLNVPFDSKVLDFAAIRAKIAATDLFQGTNFKIQAQTELSKDLSADDLKGLSVLYATLSKGTLSIHRTARANAVLCAYKNTTSFAEFTTAFKALFNGLENGLDVPMYSTNYYLYLMAKAVNDPTLPSTFDKKVALANALGVCLAFEMVADADMGLFDRIQSDCVVSASSASSSLSSTPRMVVAIDDKAQNDIAYKTETSTETAITTTEKMLLGGFAAVALIVAIATIFLIVRSGPTEPAPPTGSF
jgi:hypothetical protein